MDRRVFLKLPAALSAAVAFPQVCQGLPGPAVSGASTGPPKDLYDLTHLNDPSDPGFRLIEFSWIPADLRLSIRRMFAGR